MPREDDGRSPIPLIGEGKTEETTDVQRTLQFAQRARCSVLALTYTSVGVVQCDITVSFRCKCYRTLHPLADDLHLAAVRLEYTLGDVCFIHNYNNISLGKQWTGEIIKD